MKSVLRDAGWFVFNLFLAMLGTWRLADGVFTGVELLQTALVLINLYFAAYYGARLMDSWKAKKRGTP